MNGCPVCNALFDFPISGSEEIWCDCGHCGSSLLIKDGQCEVLSRQEPPPLSAPVSSSDPLSPKENISSLANKPNGSLDFEEEGADAAHQTNRKTAQNQPSQTTQGALSGKDSATERQLSAVKEDVSDPAKPQPASAKALENQSKSADDSVISSFDGPSEGAKQKQQSSSKNFQPSFQTAPAGDEPESSSSKNKASHLSDSSSPQGEDSKEGASHQAESPARQALSGSEPSQESSSLDLQREDFKEEEPHPAKGPATQAESSAQQALSGSKPSQESSSLESQREALKEEEPHQAESPARQALSGSEPSQESSSLDPQREDFKEKEPHPPKGPAPQAESSAQQALSGSKPSQENSSLESQGEGLKEKEPHPAKGPAQQAESSAQQALSGSEPSQENSSLESQGEALKEKEPHPAKGPAQQAESSAQQALSGSEPSQENSSLESQGEALKKEEPHPTEESPDQTEKEDFFPDENTQVPELRDPKDSKEEAFEQEESHPAKGSAQQELLSGKASQEGSSLEPQGEALEESHPTEESPDQTEEEDFFPDENTQVPELKDPDPKEETLEQEKSHPTEDSAQQEESERDPAPLDDKSGDKPSQEEAEDFSFEENADVSERQDLKSEPKESLSDVAEFAENPHRRGGPFLYDLSLKEIHSKSLTETVLSVIEDEGLKIAEEQESLSFKEKIINTGHIVLENLSPVQAYVIVTRLMGHGLDISWTQSHIADSETPKTPEENPSDET